MIKKTYIPGKPRNPKLTATTGASGVSKTEFKGVVGSSHEHYNKGVLDQITEAMLIGALRDMITSTDEETELTDDNILSSLRVLAEIAKNNEAFLEELRDLFLSKVEPDTAQGLITFVQGIASLDTVTFGNFITGLLGTGGRIDKYGHAELDSLTLRKFLEVPELRYNRVSVYTGVRWDTFGAGIIESVEIDTDVNGNQLDTGTITLKLEDGEYGAISEDDLCQGIFHNFGGSNDTENEDQRNGNLRFQGFSTSYFRITRITNTDTNGVFRYQLRPTSESWNQTHHPQPFMHFAAYANPYNTDRQACVYTTTEYTIRLDNMTTWEYGEANIYGISGKLDGFKMGETVFHGHGNVIGNAYIYGILQNIEEIIRENVQIGGKNLLREYALQFAGKYWGGHAEWKDIDIDNLLEFLAMENNNLVITENNLVIDL